MKVLVVVDHPRRDSFTQSVATAFAGALEAAGHAVERADLAREGYDPRMTPADEPDWNDPDKRYSAGVLAEQARILRSDAIVMVFPVWWWSLPATLKGWIDRVWNNGWAYGARNLAGTKAMMIGIAATGAEAYVRRGYDKASATQLDVGILQFCGLTSGGIQLLYGSLVGDAERAAILDGAAELGRTFTARFA